MSGKVFINYRRDDSDASAGRLYDRLESEFGRAQLFIDVDHIAAGADFVKVLNEQVAEVRRTAGNHRTAMARHKG